MSAVATRDLEEIGVQKLAARLRAHRLRTGWSLGELAERAGVSRSTLHHLEHGTTPHPRLLTLHRLAKAFGVEVESLVPPGNAEGAGEPGPVLDPLHTSSGGFSHTAHGTGHESSPPRKLVPTRLLPPRLLPQCGREGDLGATAAEHDAGPCAGGELPSGCGDSASGGANPEGFGARGLARGLVEGEPGLFRDWTWADWALWETRVPSSGEVGLVRLRELAREVNRHRETRLQLQALLSSPLAGVVTQLIRTLFETACREASAECAPPA